MHNYELFLDESYKDDHYYLAGILGEPKHIEKLCTEFQHIADTYMHNFALPTQPEFHAHSIMNGLDDWKILHGNFGMAISLYSRLLRVISTSGVKIYIEAVDVRRLRKRYRYPDSPHEITLRHLLERVNEHCQPKSAQCKVYADSLPREDDFKEAIHGYTRVATPGYRRQILGCIDGDVSFIDSRSHWGIQAADLCVYIVRRMREEKTGSRQSQRASTRLLKILSPVIVHERKWLP